MQRLTRVALVTLLSTVAYAADPPAPEVDPGKAFLQALDANNDGSVSEDEFIKPQMQHFLQRLTKQFAYMDKDKDSKVNAQEATAFAEEMRQNFLRQHQQ